MVKLPEPFPYDYVDELIDEAFDFYQDEDEELVYFHARLKSGGVSTHINQFITLKTDVYWREIGMEDSEGYLDDKHVFWSGETAHGYATPLSEEEVLYHLRLNHLGLDTSDDAMLDSSVNESLLV